MKRRGLVLPLLVGSALALGGCVAGMAASALGTVIRSARSQPVSNQHLQPEAREACSAHAAQYGAVHVIDVQQQTVSRIIVWGTVDDGKERRSFECAYGTSITGFKLRPITPLQ